LAISNNGTIASFRRQHWRYEQLQRIHKRVLMFCNCGTSHREFKIGNNATTAITVGAIIKYATIINRLNGNFRRRVRTMMPCNLFLRSHSGTGYLSILQRCQIRSS